MSSLIFSLKTPSMFLDELQQHESVYKTKDKISIILQLDFISS